MQNFHVGFLIRGPLYVIWLQRSIAVHAFSRIIEQRLLGLLAGTEFDDSDLVALVDVILAVETRHLVAASSRSTQYVSPVSV